MSPQARGAEHDDVPADRGTSPGMPDGEEGQVNDVPEAVRDAARKAFDARPRDVLVADLVFDSLLDGERRAVADPSRRSLRFGVPDADAGADLTVTDSGETVTVSVQVLPAQRCDIDVRTPSSSMAVTTNDTGQVEFDLVPGLMSLVIRRIRSPHAQPLQTAWVRV